MGNNGSKKLIEGHKYIYIYINNTKNKTEWEYNEGMGQSVGAGILRA